MLFYISHPRDSWITETTSGGCFIEGGRIHFLIANYRYASSLAFIQQQIRKDPLWPAGEGFYDLTPNQNQTVRAHRQWSLTKPFLAQVHELVIEYAAVLAVPVEATASDVPSKPRIGDEKRNQLEEKLRFLQRLREQKLITEEEYKLKREKLLEEL